jgi:hypothetical protein
MQASRSGAFHIWIAISASFSRHLHRKRDPQGRFLLQLSSRWAPRHNVDEFRRSPSSGHERDDVGSPTSGNRDFLSPAAKTPRKSASAVQRWLLKNGACTRSESPDAGKGEHAERASAPYTAGQCIAPGRVATGEHVAARVLARSLTGSPCRPEWENSRVAGRAARTQVPASVATPGDPVEATTAWILRRALAGPRSSPRSPSPAFTQIPCAPHPACFPFSPSLVCSGPRRVASSRFSRCRRPPCLGRPGQCKSISPCLVQLAPVFPSISELRRCVAVALPPSRLTGCWRSHPGSPALAISAASRPLRSQRPGVGSVC